MTYPIHYFQEHHKAKVTSPFGPRKDPLGSGKMVQHNGIDFGGVPRGSLWTSPYAGIVTHTGTHGGRGKVAVVRVEDTRVLQLFQHLDEFRCRVGDPVESGDPIGTNGTSGTLPNGKPSVTGPHLHYELRWDNGTKLGGPVWGDPAIFTPERAREEANMDAYVVKKGDVAWRIAQGFNITLAQMADWNPQIPDLDKIKPGQLIRVKPPQEAGVSRDDFDALDERVKTLEDTLSKIKKALYQG